LLFWLLVFSKKFIETTTRPRIIRIMESNLKSDIPVISPVIPSRIPPPISKQARITNGYLAKTFKRIPILNL